MKKEHVPVDFSWSAEIASLSKENAKLNVLVLKYEEALRWIAGMDKEKPYATYYERDLDDGTVVPSVSDIAIAALKES